MSWANDELQGIALGDERLNKRAIKLLDSLGNEPEANIPAACKGWSETKAAYRFFENDSVTAEKVLAPHIEATKQRIKEHNVVLIIQDTTQLNYSTQFQKEGIGPLKSKHHKGILLHPSIAVTPQRLCLGVIDDYHWHRERLQSLTKKERNRQNLKRPISKKESYRWLLSYSKANALAKQIPETIIVNVADRECDIYDLYHDASQRTDGLYAHWVIRAIKNRPLLNKKSGAKQKNNLWDAVRKEKVSGCVQFTLPKRGNQPSREIKQALRAKRVLLKAPYCREGMPQYEAVEVNVVLASEVCPPKDSKPIEWLLITSLPIDSKSDIENIIQYYLCRWQIEVFFKVLKSGCRVEKLQLTTGKRLDVCLAMYLIIAWRVLFISRLGRNDSNLCCEFIFEKEEWNLLYQLNNKAPPSKAPSVIEAITLLAQLGGYLNRKSDSPPGPTALWKGLAKLRIAIHLKNRLLMAYG